MSSGFSTRYDSNQSAQLKKLSRVMKLPVYKLEISYYLGSEQQRFSHDVAQIAKPFAMAMAVDCKVKCALSLIAVGAMGC